MTEITKEGMDGRGKTTVLDQLSEIEAVHMALLRTGKVLYYSGFRYATKKDTETRVWDPREGEITTPYTSSDLFCAGHAFLPDGRLLSTGGTLEYINVPQTTKEWFELGSKISRPFILLQQLLLWWLRTAFSGLTVLYLFDPATEKWHFAAHMRRGRWYPTNCALPDGGILILSGKNEGPEFGAWKRWMAYKKFWQRNKRVLVTTNKDVEVFYGDDRQLEYKGKIKGPAIRPSMGPMAYGSHQHLFPSEYPRLHVLPLTHLSPADEEKYVTTDANGDRDDTRSGRVFCSGYGPDTTMLSLKTWEWEQVDNLRYEHPRHDGNCVLLPLDFAPEDNYKARVLTFGGSKDTGLQAEPIETTEIIDLSEPSPRWRFLTEPNGEAYKITPRVNGAAVLLPDGKVMAVGGNKRARWDQPVLEVDVFDPVEMAWEHGHTPIRVDRGYHATAILLPDATVLISGTTPAGPEQLCMEVYSPYYLFDANGNPLLRPIIEAVDPDDKLPDAPHSPDLQTPWLSYGGPFEVAFTTNEGSNVRSAALLRPGAMTHAFDMEQRHIWVEIVGREDNRLIIQAPPDRHVAPPGYYMLFLLDDNGVPSEARFVWLPTP